MWEKSTVSRLSLLSWLWTGTPLALFLVSGCSAGAPKPTATTAALCATPRDPGPTTIRRLTRVEYGRTIRDLVGANLIDVDELPPDESALGFDNNADVLGSSDLLIEKYADLAETVAASVARDPGPFAPCATQGDPDATCAGELIRTFGRRAWRRELSSDEMGAASALFAAGTADAGFTEGVVRAVAFLLQSPQFLYRVEVQGQVEAVPVVDAPSGAVALTSSEMASRLSYLMWGSMPDDTLLDAARDDRLQTAEEVAQQARRLLADPRAHETVATFHAEWLGLDKVDELDKDAVIFPAFNATLRASFRAETERFVDEVVWNKEGTLGALLAASYSFVDSTLAGFYGVAAPAGAGLELVTFDPARRAGILTQASMLAVHAKANQTSPVLRGRFVREQLLCTTPPPPPPNLEIRPPPLDPRKTTRERFAQHTADAFCAGCHAELDPIGFGFEHYDGIGRWRDTESGLAVDATGALTGTDVDGAFDGAPALAQRLARSSDVQRCYATQWFRFGYGRGETTADACTLTQLTAALAAAKGDVRELLVAVTQTDAFRYRRAEVTP